MLDRFQRSWDLASACMDLLMEEKALIAFPFMASIGVAVVTLSVAVPLVPTFSLLWSQGAEHTVSSLAYVVLFVFYWMQFSLIIFFNTALVEVAMRRFDGEDASVSDGLRRALSLLPVILTYSFIAATVGTLLRLIAERVGFIGRLVVGAIGFLWTVAVALVVPVLAAEDVGPVEAIQRSVELIKRAWGEDLIGSVGIGLVFGVVIAVIIFAGGMVVIATFSVGSVGLAIALLVLLVLSVTLVALAQATLQGIYAAALYRYANGDDAIGDMDRRLLES